MNEFWTVYLHTSVFWLHSVLDLLINKLLKLSEIDCKRSLHDFEDPIIFPYNYQVNALNISYFFLLYF